MVTLDVDHGIDEDNQGFLSSESPLLDFQFSPEETVEEYVNQIVSTVAEDVEFRLGIHDLQDWFHPKMLMHPKLHALQLLTPPTAE